MTMLAIHASALSSKIASYHEFLSRYSKKKKVVYGFVEGKEDPCFYRGFIENQLPDGWDVELWPAGNKDQVFNIHKDIDWRRFPKKRICFFVDRDLSGIIPEKIKNDINVYVTDGYSIENEITNIGTCRRILTEVCGLGTIDHADIDRACDMFEQELENFLLAMVPIMTWVLVWRRAKKRAYLNDIYMRDMFSIVDGRLQPNPSPRGKADVFNYIHDQCGLTLDTTINIADHEFEFRNGNIYRTFTRGKYVFWFLIEFCRSVRASAINLFTSCTKLPPMNVTLSASNGMNIVGNRSRIPGTLRTFLNDTFCAYIAKQAA